MESHYSYKILGRSGQELINIEDIKKYLRISNSEDDNILTLMIESAIQYAENFMKISLVNKDIEVNVTNSNKAYLPFTPVAKITSIIIEDEEANIEDAFIEGNFLIMPHISCTKLKLQYIAGYEDIESIPAPIIQGIMVHIASMYDGRGEDLVPHINVLQMYQPYRKIKIF